MQEEIFISGRNIPHIDPSLEIWHWPISVYLFLGGLAAGLLFFAALMTLLKKDKEYKRKVKEIDNVALDFAESALHQQIKKGNPLSTMFYLKCKAKKRGYIEQQEVKVTGNMKFTADFGEGSTIQTTSESEENT